MRLPFLSGLKGLLTKPRSPANAHAKPMDLPREGVDGTALMEPPALAESWMTEAAVEPEAVSPAETPDRDDVHDVNHWLRMAREAREAGNATEARAMLEEAAQRFPDSAAVRHDLSRLAEAQRDWHEAERWWLVFAAMISPVWWTKTHLAHLLRRQARLAEAEALLAEALEQFPNDLPVFIDHARMAEARRDWPEAAARWAVVAERFPDAWEGLTGRGRVLREQGDLHQARDTLERAAERFPESAGPVQELARLAETERDWPAAERWWGTFVAGDVVPWWGYTGLVNALREQGKLAEAEAVLTEQFERLAHEAWPFIAYSQIAERLRDWPAAMKRWGDVVARFPDRWEGYCGQARALREQGDLAGAAEILTETIRRFPREASPLHDSALIAEAQRDWVAAETLWRQYIALQPGHGRGYLGLAFALREQGRVTAAEAALAEQLDQFAHDPYMFAEHARLAEWSRDWPEAEKRWDAVAMRFPDRIDGYLGQARALREQGRMDTAWDILTQAAAHFPSANIVHSELANLAEARSDWPAAERCWRAFINGDPGSLLAHTKLANALQAQGNTSGAEEVLAEQFHRFPNELAISIEYARQAERARNWQEAGRRWQIVVTRFPTLLEGRLGHAGAMRQQNDLAAAAEILAEAVKRHPENPLPSTELAHLAAARNDWAEANRLWTDICARFPNLPGSREAMATAALKISDYETVDQLAAELRHEDPTQTAGWFFGSASLRARGESAAADALLASASPEILRDHDVMSIWVTLPRANADWPEQLRRARLMFELYPDSAKSHMHAIFSACMAGDRDEAERYIAAARSRWPGDQSLIQAESYVAMEKRQWTRALPLLETLLTMSPNDENYLRSLDNVQRNIAEHATSE